MLPSFMPGLCVLCRLRHAVSPFLPTSHCWSRRTVSCSDSLKVFSRPSGGRRGFPAPCGAQAPPGSPTFSTLLAMPATPCGPRQTLQHRTKTRLLCGLPVRENRRRLLHGPDEAVPDCRDVRVPLWPTWFPVYAAYVSFGVLAPPPPTPHAGGVVGETFLRRDLHPARSAKLRLAHERRASGAANGRSEVRAEAIGGRLQANYR